MHKCININIITMKKSQKLSPINTLQSDPLSKQLDGQNRRQQTSSTLSQKDLKYKTSRIDTQHNQVNSNKINHQSNIKKQLKVSDMVHKKQKYNKSNQQPSMPMRIRANQPLQTQSIQLFDNNNKYAFFQTFHHKSHDLDQQQFNVIVRRQTQKSSIQNQSNQLKLTHLHDSKFSQSSQLNLKSSRSKQQQQQTSQLSQNKQNQENSQKQLLNPEKDQGDKSQNQSQSVEEQSDKDKPSVKQQQQQLKTSNNQSQQKKSNRKSTNTLNPSHPSVTSQQQQQQQQCSVGPLITAYQQPIIKKQILKSFSMGSKLSKIHLNKYHPKTQQQLRMENRYIKFQLNSLKQARQSQQLIKIVQRYQNSKRVLSKKQAIKLQNDRLIQSIKSNQLQQKSKKTVSLPKLSVHQQLELPFSKQNGKIQSPEQLEFIKTKKNIHNLQNSLSANRFHYLKKKQLLLTKIKNMEQCHHQEIDNLERFQNILKSKGISIDTSEFNKGSIMINSMPKVENHFKLQLPVTLISNPRYQKHPI